MPSIYDNICEVEQLLDTVFDIETGEIDEEKERQLLQLREQIIISGLEKLCNLRANKEAYVKALKEEEERINSKRKSEEKKIASLENYILLVHEKSGLTKSIAGTWTISTRKSTQVNILDPDWHDDRFFKKEVVEKLDKVALKEALKTEQINGVELKTNINLVVK
jgi:hypothetical protein